MAGDVDMETAITEPVWSRETVRMSDKWDSANEHWGKEEYVSQMHSQNCDTLKQLKYVYQQTLPLSQM